MLGDMVSIIPESTFLLVGAKNTVSGHSQSRKSAKHGLSAPLHILSNFETGWV